MRQAKACEFGKAALSLTSRYYQDRAAADIRQEWAELWRRLQLGDEAHTVPAGEFFQVVKLGFYLRMHDGEYVEAARLLQAFLVRPDADQSDAVTYATAVCGLIIALLHQDADEQAQSLYDELLSANNNVVRSVGIYQMRQHLLAYFDAQELDAPAAPGWSAIARLLLANVRAPQPASSGATNGQITAMLESIPREQPRRRRKSPSPRIEKGARHSKDQRSAGD